jgi:hypothetical protein
MNLSVLEFTNRLEKMGIDRTDRLLLVTAYARYIAGLEYKSFLSDDLVIIFIRAAKL